MAKKKKYTIWIIIIVIIVGGVVISRSGKDKVKYATEEVERGTIVQTVSVTGEILATSRAELDFEVSGKVKSVSVDVGDEVKSGQEIARLDDNVLRYQFVATQRARDIQQENLDLARRTWDDLKPEEKEAKKLAVRQAQAAVETAGAQLAKSVLYTPISGTVAKIDVEEGKNVVAGSTLIGSSTSFATIVQEGDFKIDVDVPESDITKIKIGQSATVTFDALSSDEVFTARVTEIEPTSTVIQDVVYYGVKLKLDSIDERFKDGMSVDVDIDTAEKPDVLMIPQRAVKNGDRVKSPDGGHAAGGKKVQILLDNGEVENVEVQTGLRGDDGMIEITSGLSEGQKVVTFVSGE